jgi:signal transduction histidine kinase
MRVNLLDRFRGHGLATIGVLAVIIVPIAVGGLYNYRQIDLEVTASVAAKRENTSFLVATVLTEKLDRLVDIGVSLATRVRFRDLVERGRWNEAVAVMRRVPTDFPFIERLLLTDPQGTLMADMPAIPIVHGRNFAFRDWYQGVTRTGAPYVSEVYQRSAPPPFNVVAVAIPIRTADARIVGILVLQVRLETFFGWFRQAPASESLQIYIVDRNGRTAFNSAQPADAAPQDLSAVPAVGRVLRGESGFVGATESAARVTAFAPVTRYGWGVVLDEPAASAFATRDSQLRSIVIVYTLLIVLAAVAGFVLLRERRSARLKAELEQQVNERTAELERSNRELESFSYSVSHDLRAPLRAIDGFSQALLEDCAAQLNASGRDYLMRIRAATSRMAHLIDDLLTLARISRTPMMRAPVDVSALADDIVRELHHSQPERQAEFHIEPGLEAHGDHDLLRVALVNLLGNAWKFTGRQALARIELGSSVNGAGERVLHVRDNGAGFDMTYADKLFGPFQRLHRQEEFPGTGIGLATAKRVIARHGGRMWADSRPGQGATFYFTL